MGFGDFLKGVGNAVMDTSKEVVEMKETLQYETDEKLKRLLKRGNVKEKMVANSLLKERGYSTEELKKILSH